MIFLTCRGILLFYVNLKMPNVYVICLVCMLLQGSLWEVRAQNTWVNVSRTIDPNRSSSGAFYLDKPSSETVEFPGQFIGDVDRGGSCTVSYLTFCPHNVTHIETSAHVLSPDCSPPTVADLENAALIGKLFLIDLTHLDTSYTAKIEVEHVKPHLDTLDQQINFIAIKTKSSELPETFDFSGRGFMALNQEAAQYMHDFKCQGQHVSGLVLDLPSIDQESDEGKLLAHRAWFGLPSSGHLADDQEKRSLIELAYFNELAQGYYNIHISPPNFRTDAAAVGVHLQKID